MTMTTPHDTPRATKHVALDDAQTAAAGRSHTGAETQSQYIGNVVYGGLDGIVTTFAVVSGVMGAELSASLVLIMGCANLFGDGFSMATGAYLSAKSEREYYERARQQANWQIAHQPDDARDALYHDYLAQGYPDADAHRMVAAHTRDPVIWTNVMMIEDRQLLADARNPLAEALVTFCAFVLAGSVPLLPYLLALIVPGSAPSSFVASLVLSGVALFGLGAAKVLVTKRRAWQSGAEMLLVGGTAAGVAYLTGALLKGFGLP